VKGGGGPPSDDPSSSSSDDSSSDGGGNNGDDEADEDDDDAAQQEATSSMLVISNVKLREQNELKVPGFPSVGTLQKFRHDLYDRVAVCGQDKHVTMVVKWLQEVEKEGVTMDSLLKLGKGFASLDRKLAVALQAILPKDLEMRVQTDRATIPDGYLMAGRQILWHIYRHLRTSPNQTKLFGLMDIVGITWFGDHAKGKNFELLEQSYGANRREHRFLDEGGDLGEGHAYFDGPTRKPSRTRWDRRKKRRRSTIPYSKLFIAPLIARTRSETRRINRIMTGAWCRGSRTETEVDQPPLRPKERERTTREKEKIRAKRGDRQGCTYKHARLMNDADEKYYRDLHVRLASRSKSPGPKGKGEGDGICKFLKKDGSCKYGENCWYKHDVNATAPAPKKGKKGRNRSCGSSRGRNGPEAAAAAPLASEDS